MEITPGESFLDLVLERAGADPLERGLQVLDGRSLPDPLLLHLPTVIAQVDTAAVLYDVRDALLRLLPPETPVTRLADLGGPEEQVEHLALTDLAAGHAGLRVSLFLDPVPPGWPGLVQINARLRRECPWDRRQTHHSLARHLIEEAYETVAALEALPPEAPGGEPDYPGYVEAEEELGDLLLQVVFHATLAAEAGAFGVEEVAEGIRRKLVRRHPHVFGDVEAATAEAVLANWEQLKREEKGRESLLDGVPEALPALLAGPRPAEPGGHGGLRLAGPGGRGGQGPRGTGRGAGRRGPAGRRGGRPALRRGQPGPAPGGGPGAGAAPRRRPLRAAVPGHGEGG